MRAAQHLLLLLAPAAAAASQLTVTLTPWCANSFRVQVLPAAAGPLSTPPYRAAAATPFYEKT